jgi:hypothetical protein
MHVTKNSTIHSHFRYAHSIIIAGCYIATRVNTFVIRYAHSIIIAGCYIATRVNTFVILYETKPSNFVSYNVNDC